LKPVKRRGRIQTKAGPIDRSVSENIIFIG